MDRQAVENIVKSWCDSLSYHEAEGVFARILNNKLIKKQKEKEMKPKQVPFPYPPTECFVDLPTPCVAECPPVTEAQAQEACAQRKDNKMNLINMSTYEAEFNAEQNQLGYLGERTYTIYHTKKNALRKEFNLDDDESPATPTELVERIKAGKFVIPEDYKDYRSYGCSERYIKWRDPEAKKDEAGFKAAMKKLDAIKVATEDFFVMSNDNAARLAKLQEFESATVH